MKSENFFSVIVKRKNSRNYVEIINYINQFRLERLTKGVF